MSSLAATDVRYQKFLEYSRELPETSGKVFKNLTDFRGPYDLISALTQKMIGVIGASGQFQSPEEAKEFYDSSPKGEFGKPVLLLRLFQNYRDICLENGTEHVFVQFTPWNFYDPNDLKGKSPKPFYEVLKKVHKTCPGFYTFSVTIVKQFGKGTVVEEPVWSKAVNTAFIEFALEANLEAGYHVVKFIGAASNEAPQEGQTIPPAGVGSWKPTSEKPGREAVQNLISIIDEAKKSLIKKYGEAKVEKLCNLSLSFHAGEEHNTGHYDPIDFVKAVLEHPNTVSIGHGVSIGKDISEGKHVSTTQMTGGQQIIMLDKWVKDAITKGIFFEVCLTSNQYIDSSGPSFEFLNHLLKHGIQCVLGTDDPALFGITLCDEYIKYGQYMFSIFKKNNIELGMIIQFVETRLKTLANNSLNYAFSKGNFPFNDFEQFTERENNKLKFDSSISFKDALPKFVKALHKCDVHTHIGALFPCDLILDVCKKTI